MSYIYVNFNPSIAASLDLLNAFIIIIITFGFLLLCMQQIEALNNSVAQLKTSETQLNTNVTELKAVVAQLKSGVVQLKADAAQLKAGQCGII